VCDHENNNLRILETGLSRDKDEEKQRRQASRQLKRINGMLTPMSKYYASEMACRVTNQAVQVLGGSGYMKDYAAERYLRDSRITTIYEGTSQLQVLAAVRGVTSGALDTFLADFESLRSEDPAMADLRKKLVEAHARVVEAVRYVKSQPASYLDLSGRRLVDSAIILIVGHLFLGQAERDDRKKRVARRFIESQLSVLAMNLQQVHQGDMSPLEDYELLAGPIPTRD
jgi:3-(methylthio)propanoyl-CoA dehydrogenase